MDVTIPKIAEDVETAEVVRILVEVGDSVTADQPLLELEGDKASFELPSPGDGKVSDICVSRGDEVEVGDLVAVLEAASSEEAPPTPRTPDAGAASAPEAAEDEPQSSDEAPAPSSGARSTRDDTAPVRATPTARRRARELDVALEQVAQATSAPRITAAEVEERANDAATSEASDAGDEPETIELSRRRRLTGAKMTEAWRTIPHVTQHHRIDVTALDRSRRRLAEAQDDDEPRVTWTALALKALATALERHPRFNASLDDDEERIHLHSSVDVAIATDTPKGLLAPVIRDVGACSLRSLAQVLDQLQRRIQDETIAPEELDGATFTLSNLGAIGGGHFNPIITPPQVAVLGLGRAARDEEGGPLWLPVSLSYDHRVADGAEAARFLMSLETRLREPLALLYDG